MCDATTARDHKWMPFSSSHRSPEHRSDSANPVKCTTAHTALTARNSAGCNPQVRPFTASARALVHRALPLNAELGGVDEHSHSGTHELIIINRHPAVESVLTPRADRPCVAGEECGGGQRTVTGSRRPAVAVSDCHSHRTRGTGCSRALESGITAEAGPPIFRVQ